MFVELRLKVSHRALQNAVLSHVEKPFSKNLSQEEKVHCRLPHAASAAASVTKQSFPEESLLGELLSLERLLTSFSQQAQYMGNIQKVVGICRSSAWCQQRQRSDDRPFPDETLGLSSKAPSSLKHIWTNPRGYRSRRWTFFLSFGTYAFLFYYVHEQIQRQDGWINSEKKLSKKAEQSVLKKLMIKEFE